MQTTFLILFSCVGLTVLKIEAKAVESPAITEQGYSTKYDNFDVKKILGSTRLVKKYVDCLMDRTPCPPEGKFIKDIVPDAISSKCGKCNEAQRKQAGLILSHLLLNERAMFLDLCSKYDPTGEARKENGIDDPDYQDATED